MGHMSSKSVRLNDSKAVFNKGGANGSESSYGDLFDQTITRIKVEDLPKELKLIGHLEITHSSQATTKEKIELLKMQLGEGVWTQPKTSY